MKFNKHVPNAEASALLTELFARDLSIAEICRLSGLSRKPIDGIRSGKPCRRKTFNQLSATLDRIQKQERRHTDAEYFKERNEAYAKANASLWGRLKNWLILRLAI